MGDTQEQDEIQRKLEAALSLRYDIERRLGEGGMAFVFLGKDVKHERQVAIKVLKPELASSLGAERFLREIQITAKLQHPNILPLYDSGEAEGLLYYIMPFVVGESLSDLIAREKQLGILDAVQITREVAEALGYAHSYGLIHRDIKPDNVMMSNGHAIVADFGIARAMSEAGADKLTQTGMAVGTPAYMSPEQAAGARQDVDTRTDVYSLGVVLYELLSGRLPFDGETTSARVWLEKLAGGKTTHSAEHITKAKLTEGLTGAAVIATYDPNNPASAGSAQVALLIGQLVNLKFGRDDELESDFLGVCFMSQSGYDPNEMIEVIEILAASSQGNRPPEFFSTHPNPESRVARIQEAIQNIANCPQ